MPLYNEICLDLPKPQYVVEVHILDSNFASLFKIAMDLHANNNYSFSEKVISKEISTELSSSNVSALFEDFYNNLPLIAGAAVNQHLTAEIIKDSIFSGLTTVSYIFQLEADTIKLLEIGETDVTCLGESLSFFAYDYETSIDRTSKSEIINSNRLATNEKFLKEGHEYFNILQINEHLAQVLTRNHDTAGDCGESAQIITFNNGNYEKTIHSASRDSFEHADSVYMDAVFDFLSMDSFIDEYSSGGNALLLVDGKYLASSINRLNNFNVMNIQLLDATGYIILDMGISKWRLDEVNHIRITRIGRYSWQVFIPEKNESHMLQLCFLK